MNATKKHALERIFRNLDMPQPNKSARICTRHGVLELSACSDSMPALRLHATSWGCVRKERPSSTRAVIRKCGCSPNRACIDLDCDRASYELRPCLVAFCKIFEKTSFYIWSTKHKLIIKLNTELVGKSRDESNEPNQSVITGCLL